MTDEGACGVTIVFFVNGSGMLPHDAVTAVNKTASVIFFNIFRCLTT